ncbi:MAG: hypothetical protein HEP71_01115 [Roseivirga sp.]|nr:hypothetical protein [Roseivirga sp.]
MSKLYFTFFLFFGLLFSCNSGSGNTVDSNNKSIQDARNAYFQMDHKTAYSIFTNVWNDHEQRKEDRAMAGLFIAKMDWLFYQNSDRAFNMLESLEPLKESLSALYGLKGRILADEGRFEEAISASRSSIELGESETEKYRGTMAYCENVLAKYKFGILKGAVVSDDQELKNAYELLQEMANGRPGDVDLAGLYLGYSLLLQKGQEAFDAWMSYYRLTDIEQVHASLLADVDKFKRALSQYSGVAGEEKYTEDIILGLAESGFYEYAVLVHKMHNDSSEPTQERMNEILLYHDFLQKIEAVSIDFYLQTVAGKGSEKKYKKAMRNEAEGLWASLIWSGSKPEFSDEAFVKEVEKRFKAILTFINANGYYGLHMGHIVLDDKKLISQHGNSAEFRYISIDHMVSNGYSGWFWDGQAETGGWAGNDESFLQVRSAYTSGPTRAWLMLTDSVEIRKTKERMKEMTVQDDALAKENPYSFLPGLSTRITYNEGRELLDSLQNTGLSDGPLRLAFINLMENIVQGASIYAHEGRHAIDKKNGYSKNSEELEFTAKLSEIYFSKKPLYSFRAIMNRNIGDGTSHGNSNLRVIKALVAWMDEHRTEIKGFDADRPTLPQIDKLSDQQLRAAVKSVDPMVK